MSDGVYREAAPAPDLSDHVACLWHRRVGEQEASHPLRVMPDGCMDLIWTGDQLLIAGPDTTAHVSRAPAGAEILGLRFRPGAAPPVLGLPATELLDERPSAAVAWGRAAADVTARLETARSPAAAALVLQDAVRQHLAAAPALDPLVQHVVASVERAGDRPVRVDLLAERVGISQRQLHRRCCAALGYGPKTFARIARFQRFLTCARAGAPGTLARAAADSGYADQPHLVREVRRLAGVLPTELVAALVD